MAKSSQRIQTTKLQRSGHDFMVNAVSKGYVTRKPYALSDPHKGGHIALGIGGIAVVIGLVIMFVLSVVKPSPNQGDAAIMISQSGGLFVQLDGKLHPVTNLASARLLVGSPEKASVVKDDVLSGFTRGPLLGIPSAPNNLAQDTSDDAVWTVCDWQDSRANLSLTEADSLTTTVIAGGDMLHGGKELGASKAIVATTDGSDRWLLFGNKRAVLDPRAYGLHSALGISTNQLDSPMIVTKGLINAIPAAPDLAAPDLDNNGKESEKVRGYLVGDVIATLQADGQRQYLAVQNEGVQQVPYVVAQTLLHSGGRINNVTDPSQLSTFPRSNEINTGNYPGEIPELIDPDTICYSWQRDHGSNRAVTAIITSDTLPITQKGRDSIVELLPAKNPGESAPLANRFLTDPGKGWYVRVTGGGDRSDAAEQVAFVDDGGTRYNLVPELEGQNTGDYSEVAKALGLSGTPLPIPAHIADLLPMGSDLSVAGARTEHVKIRGGNPDAAQATVTETVTATPEPAPESASSTPRGSTSREAPEEQGGEVEDDSDEDEGYEPSTPSSSVTPTPTASARR